MSFSKKDSARLKFIALAALKVLIGMGVVVSAVALTPETTWEMVLRPYVVLPAAAGGVNALWAILSRRWSEIAREIED